ncbi:30S ribosomal protein S8, partial [Candidatus Bipolaricaulota bacterium]|nr:30S ribosomal protein S8 [Candidatus Bipolaricaulota bacterium]
MTIENPIADILTRIRNASAKFHPQVLVPNSNIKEKMVSILKQEGYIKGFDVVAGEHAPMLRIDLKYLGERRQATRAITALRQVSKPS